jgi:Zn-dependent protease
MHGIEAAAKATSESNEHADIEQSWYEKTVAEIDNKISSRKKSWLKNIAILVVSLFIFFKVGSFSWGLEWVLLVLLVLVVHETGHYVSMKMFGYTNLQMFLIPMFGAAVSGVSRNVAVWKKAVVSLMGPLPGIIIGMVLMIIAVRHHNRSYLDAGGLFVFINAFNLLPINPLDGGRFLHELIFSRNRYAEAVVNVLSAVGLFVLATAFNSWVFRILGIFSLTIIPMRFKIAKCAHNFKKELAAAEVNSESAGDNGKEYIPEHVLKSMLNWMHTNMPHTMNPKEIANIAVEIWDRIRISPPRWPATTALLIVFLLGYILSFVSLGIAAVGIFRNTKAESKIVGYQDPNQRTCYKEEQSKLGRMICENQLSEDRKVYNGFHRAYYVNKALSEEGWWKMGKRDGKWCYYDKKAMLIKEIIYQEGIPSKTNYLDDDKWKEERWEDYTGSEKKFYIEDANERYGPIIREEAGSNKEDLPAVRGAK